jgi:hypothetical protein
MGLCNAAVKRPAVTEDRVKYVCCAKERDASVSASNVLPQASVPTLQIM